MRYKVKERTAADVLLGSVTIAEPSRYAPAAPSKYAPAVNRYSVAAPRVYAPAPSRYAAATEHRYAPASRYAAGPKRKLVRRTVLVIPPMRTGGDLLYVPAHEFERFFDYGEFRSWTVGDVVEFNSAALANFWQCDAEPEDALVIGVGIDSESDTFVDDEYECYESPLWPDARRIAAALRAELVADPEWLVANFDTTDLWNCKAWAGASSLPMPEDILVAVATSPNEGLGGAALDYATWVVPDQFGHDGRFGCRGEELAVALDAIREEEGCPHCIPQQTFLLWAESLHPDTRCRTTRYGRFYDLFGDYIVAGASYHSDLTGTVPGGWQSLYLEPIGIPTMPDFG